MRWTIEGFSQNVLLSLGLDATDAVILRFIADFYLSGRMSKITVNEKVYFWLHYANVIAEIPILKIDKRQLSNKLDYMVEAGIMEKEVVRCGVGSKAYFRFKEETFAALVCSDEYLEVRKKEHVDASVEKAERSELRDLFFRYYKLKALEVRGKEANPVWAAKEASLLKQDSAQFGMGEMIRAMRFFFSDSVTEVSDFTRTKMKAGYSYSVFHGMLGKLMMANGDVTDEPCPECGMWGGHRMECSRRPAPGVSDLASKQEVLKTKDEVASMNISKMFNEAVGKSVMSE
jgi:hypothetical protein